MMKSFVHSFVFDWFTNNLLTLICCFSFFPWCASCFVVLLQRFLPECFARIDRWWYVLVHRCFYLFPLAACVFHAYLYLVPVRHIPIFQDSQMFLWWSVFRHLGNGRFRQALPGRYYINSIKRSIGLCADCACWVGRSDWFQKAGIMLSVDEKVHVWLCLSPPKIVIVGNGYRG